MAGRKNVRSRAAARKQKDKWKAKRWYNIRAPRFPWNYQQIGETLGEADENILGRIYEMTQQEFDGDFTKMHVKLRFRVTDVVGSDALTQFIGHQHQNDYTRRQIRRYRGKVDGVYDAVTTDGYLIRLKTLVITDRRIQTSIKQVIRAISKDIILGFAAKSTFAKLQKGMLGSELEEALKEALKPISRVRSAVVRKSQLMQEGVVVEDGPTLDEVHQEEQRTSAEAKARKAAALEAAMSEEDEEAGEDEDGKAGDESEEVDILTAAEALESTEKGAAEETPEETPDEAAEEPVAEETTDSAADEDLTSLTVAELKTRLKSAGKPVSGKKDELIARLQE
ncbi:MAG TPA: 30S ribosomal protein S3ae [Candidatus Poseidoniales archaeon]|nr:30S ribosomal protein S3ae [Candidatus Poseidoniales archaeon]